METVIVVPSGISSSRSFNFLASLINGNQYFAYSLRGMGSLLTS